MIEIVINGRFLTQPITGVQRYAYELVRSFNQMIASGQIDPQIFSITLAVPPELKSLPQFEHITIKKIGRLKSNLWEQLSLPLYSHNKFLFNPCNTGPIFGGKNQIVTIHDASVFAIPQAYTKLFRLKYRIITLFLGKFARKILTDSLYSKKELTRFGKISPEKIEVIYLGADHILNTIPDNSIFIRHAITKPYILAVSSNSIHKNFKAIIQALPLIQSPKEFELIIVGGNFSKVFQSSANEDLPQSANRIGYVTDAELRALYEHAQGFVYPSLYEGFGFPPLEAMLSGCPVILSSAASLPEVGGDAVLYCNPHDINDIAKKMETLLNDEALCNLLKEKGSAQSRLFHWNQTAQKTWEVIKQYV